MSRRRAPHRTRRQLRAELADRDALIAELAPIVATAEAYVSEVFLPNLKEPFSIHNRRAALIDSVERRRAARGMSSLRRAA